MKRRDFLKILSAAPLVVAVPALAKTDKPAYFSSGVQTFKNEAPRMPTNARPSKAYIRNMQRVHNHASRMMVDSLRSNIRAN